MAGLLQPDNDLAPNQNTAGATGTATNIASSNGGAPSLSPTSNSSPAATPKVSQEQIGQLNQGFDFSPLLGTVQSQGTTAKNALNTAQSNFNTALGSAPVFGADQQNTLQSVLSGSQPLSVGQNLLNTQYSGPSGIDTSTYAPLVQKYSTSANNLKDDSGFATLEGGLQPGLTPGERAFDATIFGQNPNAQSQAKNIINDANTVKGQGSQAVTDANSAISQRQNDINAFNTAAQGFVTSQRDSINQALNSQVNAANQYDTGVQNELAALRNGSLNLGNIGRNDLTFDPNAFQPVTIGSNITPGSMATVSAAQNWQVQPFGGVLSDGSRMDTITAPDGSQYRQAYDRNGNIVATYDMAGRPVSAINTAQITAPTAPALADTGPIFNATIDPRQFLTYNPGQLATRENVATQDQVTRYNNAEALLGLYDQLTQAAPRQAATMGMDASTLNQALAQAQAARNAADAAWLQAHQPAAPPQVPMPTLLSGGFDGYEGGGDAGNGEGGAGDEGGSGGSGGGGPGEGGGTGGSESDNLAKGGLVKGRPNKPDYGFSTLAGPRLAMQDGGYLPPGTGIPGVTDSIPANVNDGEFVTRASSVKSLGKGNLAALNDIDHAPPAKQAMVKNALHTALKQAQSKSYQARAH